MSLFVSNKNESVRLFKNPVLEYFSHVHPAVPVFVFLPVILYFLVQSFSQFSVILSLSLIFSGLAIWTALEYSIHRFLFHYKPTTPMGKRIIFLVHGNHHDYPKDSTRLVLPLMASIPLAIFFGGLFHFLFGAYYAPLFAGLGAGYLSYDCLHFACHHFPMNNRILRAIKLAHLRHHYQDPESGFCVSQPWFDSLFGTETGQEEAEVERLEAA